MKKYSDSAITPSGKDIQFSLINQKEIELNFSYILDFITEIEDLSKNYKYPIFHILSFFFISGVSTYPIPATHRSAFPDQCNIPTNGINKSCR